MAEEDVDWGMDEDFDPWQGAEEVNGSAAAERPVDENRNGQERGMSSGNVGRVESTAENQQRYGWLIAILRSRFLLRIFGSHLYWYQSARSKSQLAIGWTIRSSRRDPAKQYFYNPYTQATSWEQPQEPLFDESGITTPPLPQLRQEPPTGMQIRSSGRLTDHMKMAPIQQQSVEAPPTSSTPASSGFRESRPEKSFNTPEDQRATTPPSKLRLIDRIQPARYAPPEKNLSIRSSNGSVSRDSPAGSSHRPERAASDAIATPAESSNARESSRVERMKPSSLPLTSQSSQPSTGPNDTTSKEDTFASQKYAEKLPEWLEANDPKLVSDDSSRRRMRGEDETMAPGASKRPRFGPESVVVKDSASAARSDDRNTRQDTGSRPNDKPNSRDAPLSDRDRTRPPESGKTPDFGSAPRPSGSDHVYPDRQASDHSRSSNAREPPGSRPDDRKFTTASAVHDRTRATLSNANSFELRGNPGSPTNQAPPSSSGSLGVRPSGSNTAPLIANRWAGAMQSQSSRPPEPPSAAVPSRNDTNVENARAGQLAATTSRPSESSDRASNPKEYAYGPKANKNINASLGNDGPRRMSGPGPVNQPPFDSSSRRIDASPPLTTRPMPDGPSQMSGSNAQSGFRQANGPSMSSRAGSSYGPDPPSRDVWLGNPRGPVPPHSGAMPDRAGRPPMEAQGPMSNTRRGDSSFGNAWNSRPPPPPSSGRARSPVAPFAAQGRPYAPERPGPPARRSPSPVRFGPGPPVRHGDRRDDRIPRTPDALAPMPNPRDAPRPHPRAPDMYTPGRRSPPRQSPRPPVPPFAYGDAPRDERFDARRGPPPPPGRGSAGRR
ncbi:hypothetical protein NliqN6_0456 [Naganishia liquefaciens]|uniref:WW domain-containing protein n=1 Tax=Naganishia liquefaciens TaxID=104408 RepID=A0A8H3YC94_9TREE|nr:hypothetical protein NliqN6_0456 [Naganishia liquefaciens]